MTPPPTTLPLSLFWALEAGGLLIWSLLQGLALSRRGKPGGVGWILLLAMGTQLMLLLLLSGVQVGQFPASAMDGALFFNLELAGVAVSGMLHLVLSWLFPRPRPMSPPPAPVPLRQQGAHRHRRSPMPQERGTHRGWAKNSMHSCTVVHDEQAMLYQDA